MCVTTEVTITTQPCLKGLLCVSDQVLPRIRNLFVRTVPKIISEIVGKFDSVKSNLRVS